jgi:hypothetical protein
MTELLPCACGVAPDKLEIQDANQGGKWMNVSGNCCASWSIEARTEYNRLDTPECLALAIEAWNEAPRAKPTLSKPQAAAVAAAIGAIKYVGGLPRTEAEILAVGNHACDPVWAESMIAVLRSLDATPQELTTPTKA